MDKKKSNEKRGLEKGSKVRRNKIQGMEMINIIVFG